MTQDDKKQLEILLSLFEHEGWGIFINDRKEVLESLKEHAHINCPTNDQWQFNRGMIAILEGIISYETSVKFVLEQDALEEEEFNQE